MIRDATIADAERICDVLRRSIVQLCLDDHHGDGALIERWLDNKTTHEITTWIVTSQASILVGELAGKIVIVGGVTDSGRITLNYVDPDFRLRKLSTGMLSALEQRAREKGAKRFTLVSTLTAQHFYRQRGYCDVAEDKEPAITMVKDI